MKIDLGFTPESGEMPGAITGTIGDKGKTPEPIYPDITVRDKPGLCKAYKAGDTFTAEVEFRVVKVTDAVKSSKGYGDDKPSCELELVSMEVEGAEDTEEEMGPGEAMDEYFGPKGAPVETPMGEAPEME